MGKKNLIYNLSIVKRFHYNMIYRIILFNKTESDRVVKKMRGLLALSAAILLGVTAAGCGSKATTSPPASSADSMSDNTQATLSFMGDAAFSFTDGTNNDPDHFFGPQVEALIKKQFPNLTIKKVPGKNTDLKQMVANGQAPDIFFNINPSVYFPDMISTGLVYDLNPLVKTNKLNLQQYATGDVQNVLNYASKGELYGIPVLQRSTLLVYNKDIFDKFGVAYPKDGMTWPDITSLAKQMTRNDGGVQYHGLLMDNYYRISNEMPLLAVDPATDQATVASDPNWAKAMNIYQSIYTIAGNYDPKGSTAVNTFEKDKTAAMLILNMGWTNLRIAEQTGLHWDIVSEPTLPENPKQTYEADDDVVSISSTCQNKDLAFKVIEFLSSPAMVAEYGKLSASPVIINQQTTDAFCSDYPDLFNKHVKAAFYGTAAIPKKSSPYEYLATTVLSATAKDIASGTDVNTALRQAQDAINKQISDAKQIK
ncbi:MAG: extracellular solute-binding protein family 1 [Bacilli bacterium]|nr:extracellular solute-binding protein family 1 [Bacilli bacterium]